MPASDSKVTLTMSTQLPPGGTFRSRPMPRGSHTNTNGTRNAGMVYFQA